MGWKGYSMHYIVWEGKWGDTSNLKDQFAADDMPLFKKNEIVVKMSFEILDKIF